MPRLLHAADLHLSLTEKEYGLSVFSELLETARREKVDYLVFCGDLFNTFADAEGLRADLRQLIGTPEFEFLYLPGNHEDLGRGALDLARLDLGNLTLLDAKPFQCLRRDRGGVTLELLAVPHQEHYALYSQWPVPAKSARWRVAMAHGIVAGMAYRGPDEESGGAALDPDLFHRFQVDYAALGHIHGRRCQTLSTISGQTVMAAYPGSTRLWRRGETGLHGAYLLELPSQDRSGLQEPQFLPLSSAGEYRQYPMPLSLEGEAPDLERVAAGWGRNDWIELVFSGLVEDEKAVARLSDQLLSQFAKRVRGMEIRRDGVSALPGISSHPVAKQFLEAWKARRPAQAGSERNVWIRARELALNALKARLEHK